MRWPYQLEILPFLDLVSRGHVSDPADAVDGTRAARAAAQAVCFHARTRVDGSRMGPSTVQFLAVRRSRPPVRPPDRKYYASSHEATAAAAHGPARLSCCCIVS